MGKEGVYGIRNADRVPMGGARLVRNVSLEGRTMRTEGGAASLGTAIGSAGRASPDYWRFYVSGSQQSVPTRWVKHSLSASQAARGEDQRGAADRRGPLDQDPRRADPSTYRSTSCGTRVPMSGPLGEQYEKVHRCVASCCRVSPCRAAAERSLVRWRPWWGP